MRPLYLYIHAFYANIYYLNKLNILANEVPLPTLKPEMLLYYAISGRYKWVVLFCLITKMPMIIKLYLYNFLYLQDISWCVLGFRSTRVVERPEYYRTWSEHVLKPKTKNNGISILCFSAQR